MNERPPTRPQTTVGRFLSSTVLIGAGIGCLLAAFSFDENWPDWQKLVAMLQFLAAGPLVGGGLLTPFRYPRVGAYVGFFAGIIAGIIGLVMWFGAEDVLRDFRHVIALTLVAVVLGFASALRLLIRRRHIRRWPEEIVN